MPLQQLQLSLQFGDIPDAARHRAALGASGRANDERARRAERDHHAPRAARLQQRCRTNAGALQDGRRANGAGG